MNPLQTTIGFVNLREKYRDVIKWNCRVNAKLNTKNSGREIVSIIITFSFSVANVAHWELTVNLDRFQK